MRCTIFSSSTGTGTLNRGVPSPYAHFILMKCTAYAFILSYAVGRCVDMDMHTCMHTVLYVHMTVAAVLVD